MPIVSSSSVTPRTQFSSRGRRNAPVKNTRVAWNTTAPVITSAAQWWICRNTSPARTSNEMRMTDSYARDMDCPSSGLYGPW